MAAYVLDGARGGGADGAAARPAGFLVPLYDAEGKAYISVAVGCTGGRHRSVAIVEALARELRAAGREVNVTHRDVEKGE